MADNKQMKLKIEYDDINKAEKPVQSLVNFFTNNCVLRMLNKIEAEGADPESISIDPKFVANIINDSKLDDNRTVIASIKYEDNSGEVEGESNDLALVQENGTNPIIDCDTKFVKANTALKFYEMGSVEEISEDAKFSKAGVEPIPMMEEIPVTITPYYDGKENTDADITPIFGDDDLSTEDIDESIIQNYEITKRDLAVDWKLRTTTFTLQSDGTYYDVFYKVGFCPADGKESTEKEVINALKVYTFTINNNNFTLEYPEWAAYKFDFNKQQQRQQYYITGKPTWLPVYQHDEFNGIMYIELYNSEDGTKFTDDNKEYTVRVEFDETAYSNFYAPLKDYMLDKGNIPSVHIVPS